MLTTLSDSRPVSHLVVTEPHTIASLNLSNLRKPRLLVPAPQPSSSSCPKDITLGPHFLFWQSSLHPCQFRVWPIVFKAYCWTGPRNPRNHLLQNPPASNFTTGHSICHCQWLHKSERNKSLLNQSCGTLMGDLGEDLAPLPMLTLSRNRRATGFKSNTLKQTLPCILSGSISYRCKKRRKIHSTF